MSWFEVQKINSDFMNEPLNFNNYINDISVFGDKSYVLDKSNEPLFHSLLTQSLTMFGHQEIHQYIYNRMTTQDIDVMIEGNARLGQALNSFYRTGAFTSGNIDKVLRNIKSTDLNSLEMKLQDGVVRYIAKKTAGEGAAAWLQSVFNVDMSGFTTMESIITDVDFWNNTIVPNESFAFVVCISYAAIDTITTMSGTKFVDFIRIVAQSTPATTYLLRAYANTGGALENLFSVQEVCNIFTSSEESMVAIIKNLNAFEYAIKTKTMIDTIIASEIASGVIIQAVADSIDQEQRLNSAKDSLTNIQTQFEGLPDSSSTIDEIGETIEHVNNTLLSIADVNNLADIIIKNIKNFYKLFNKLPIESRKYFVNTYLPSRKVPEHDYAYGQTIYFYETGKNPIKLFTHFETTYTSITYTKNTSVSFTDYNDETFSRNGYSDSKEVYLFCKSMSRTNYHYSSSSNAQITVYIVDFDI